MKSTNTGKKRAKRSLLVRALGCADAESARSMLLTSYEKSLLTIASSLRKSADWLESLNSAVQFAAAFTIPEAGGSNSERVELDPSWFVVADDETNCSCDACKAAGLRWN